MTLIFSNIEDGSSRRMLDICSQIHGFVVLEITSQSQNFEDYVDNAIAQENNIILFVGPGNENGLLLTCDCSVGSEEYIVHQNNVSLINAKVVICLWNKASIFCKNNNIQSVALSDFIYNVADARRNGLNRLTQEQINTCNNQIFEELCDLILEKSPLSSWVHYIGANIDVDNEIDVHNRQQFVLVS